jgi:transposase InsO family protein
MVQSFCSGSVQWAFGTIRSPWQNAYVERLIGSIRRECLDHMIVFGEAHLRRILRGYAAYYNVSRTHRSLNKDAPLHRAIERLGAVVSWRPSPSILQNLIFGTHNGCPNL